MGPFKSLFGVASEDLRAIVTETLQSQRIIIADQQRQLAEANVQLTEARVEATSLRAENLELRNACDQRTADLEELKGLLKTLPAPGEGQIPDGSRRPPKPPWANSSTSGNHNRRVPEKDKPAGLIA